MYICQRSDLKNPEVPKFSFGKHKALWHYSTVVNIEDDKKGFDKVVKIAIVCIDSVWMSFDLQFIACRFDLLYLLCFTCQTFNPEKFGALSEIFLEKVGCALQAVHCMVLSYRLRAMPNKEANFEVATCLNSMSRADCPLTFWETF